jgi:tyrosine-protein kinase Etk/Wzc
MFRLYLMLKNFMETDKKESVGTNLDSPLFTNDIEKSMIILAELIYFFLQRKFKILVSFVLLMALTLYLYFSIPDYYVANVSFIPPPPEIVTTYNDSLSSMTASPFSLAPKLSLMDPVQIYVEILTSKLVKQDIINKFHLMDEFHTQYNDDALKTLDAITLIKISNGLVAISIKYTDPKLAADIANAYVERITFVLNNLSAGEIKKGRLFLEKRLSEVRYKLIVANKNLKDFKVKKKMIDITTQSNLLVTNISAIKAKIFEQEGDLAALRATYTDKSPKVRAAIAELETLKTELNKRTQISNQMGSNADGPSLLDIPGVGVDYVDREREVKILEEVYLMLNKEYELSKLKEAKESVTLKVVDRAIIPDKRTNSTSIFKIMIITIMCLVLILGFYFIKFFLAKLNNFSPENNIIIANLKSNIKNEVRFRK